MSNILIIEDDPAISEVLELILTTDGHHCRRASNGTKGLEETEKQVPDLITLDIMLGEDRTGLDICKEIRDRYPKKIIIFAITAKGDKCTRTLASEHGVDLFIEKPFDADLLRVYARTLPKRIKEITGDGAKPGEKKEDEAKINSKFLTLDLARKKVYANTSSTSGKGTKKEFKVSDKEMSVLSLLIEKGITLSRREILREVWETDENIDPRNVDKQVWAIRRKINKAYGEKVELIVTQPGGYGYVAFVDPQSEKK
jgi:DNA-binding response OmpR family regulator